MIASSGIPVLDMAANTADLGKLVATSISTTMVQYGLTIPELYIENISLPPAVEAALDKRTSMGIAGDLGNFMQYSTSEAMTAAASNPNGGGGMGAGLGMGMGMAMATQMQAGPWGASPTPPLHRRRQLNMFGILPLRATSLDHFPRLRWAARSPTTA